MKRAVLILALLAAPAAADADVEDVCDDSIVDPVPVAIRDGDFDATRSACLRSDLQVRTSAHALVDTPGFYGTLGGDLFVGIRFLESQGFEWGASLRLLNVTFAQTAVVAETELQFGPIGIHGALGRAVSPRLHLAGLAAVELPFTRSSVETSRAGGQVAGLATWRAAGRVTVHGRLAGIGWYGSSAGGTSTRRAVVLSSDVAVRTIRWLDAFAGAEVSSGWHRGGVDHVAARVGAHWRVFGPWRVDAGVMLPLSGEDRTDLAFTLGLRRDRQ